MAFRFGNKAAITPEVDNLLEPVTAVDCKYRENGEINDQDGPVESIELIQWTNVSPGLVYKVAEILLEQRVRRWTKRRAAVLKNHNDFRAQTLAGPAPADFNLSPLV